MSLAGLASLEEVGGDLVAPDNVVALDGGLTQLRVVGGTLDIAVEGASLPALASVGGNLTLSAPARRAPSSRETRDADRSLDLAKISGQAVASHARHQETQ